MMYTRLRWAALLAVSLAIFSCDDTTEPPTGGGTIVTSHDLVEAFQGLTFVDPVDCQNAGDSRLFVVERAGRIMVFDTASPATPAVFLDIRTRVRAGGEMGLLGLAFHPQYASNGYFYVNYTTGDPALVTRVSRFMVTGDPNVADASSEANLLEFPQPDFNHNAGSMAFGPGPGAHLFVAVGDGGGSGDPGNNAQDPTNLLGSILRLDVNASMSMPPYYGIPADNPFVGNTDGWREEIWAYGLRNPWRISYDAASDRLWAGDVGQNSWEEVDVIEKGKNYGWDCFEGTHPFASASPACTLAVDAYQAPVWEYPRSEGFSVTGGYVYRGPSALGLTGRYIYGDYGSGKVWALSWDGTGPAVNEELIDSEFAISTFGRGTDGEVYALTISTTGRLYRLIAVEARK